MRASDLSAVWLGDNTNQLWKVDETQESYACGYLRQCLTCICVMTAYLPAFRYRFCAQTPGGTIADYNRSLRQLFGEEALLIEKNPELDATHLTVCNAGNGLTYEKETGNISTVTGEMNTKKMYMSTETLDEITQKEYELFH